MADGISARLVENELNIPAFAIGLLSEDRLACVVPESWFNCLCSQRRATVLDNTLYEHLSCADARLLLSLATSRLLSGWRRITLNVIKKCSKVVESLIEQPLCLGHCSAMSLSGIKAFVSEQRMKCLQQDAEERYGSAIQLTCESDVYKPCLKEYNNFVREVLNRVYCRHVIPLEDGQSSVDDGNLIENDFQSATHPGILISYAVIESSKAFYVVHPFHKYTVSDLVTFSPSKLRDDTQNTKLFVLFELLKAVRHLHSHGISIYNMSLKDILIDDQLWVQIIPPPIDVLCHSTDTSDGGDRVLASSDSLSKTSLPLRPLPESSDLPSVVQQWVYREISNFDYLMMLNKLAGRNTNDPNHYPILPWVTDFASPSRTRRDLTKTKYRLNKGDEQLDLTFDVSNPESIMRSAGQTPFHVSDFLSDITYYVYNARRTPKDVLCKFVRPRWVPNHYPVSLQRLYEWTPDECIPEFFTDPQIFVSIHDDLPDLELPTWANSAEEFVRIHREILESDYVSENLHHWIDLTFGYKLSGAAAVSSKNICLQLVDRHKQLQNHGVVQLFHCPHPPRHHQTYPPSGGEILNDLGAKDAEMVSSLAVGQPKLNVISPLFALEQLESLFEFTMKTTNSLPPSRTSKKKDKQGRLQLLVARDMQTIGCLIVELFLPKTWVINQPENNLRRRYEHARKICQANLNELPLCIRKGVTYLLNLNEAWNPDLELKDSLGEVFRYPSVGLEGLPPPNIDILLHPSFCLLNFPVYFENLHTYLTKMKSLSVDSSPDSVEVNGQVENQKVFLLSNVLTRISYRMGPDGLNLVIPHILELLRNHVSSVQCAWSLFYPVAQALGPSASAQHLLPPLVSLFDTEETTVKYLKIYHRSFINQLIVRLGLEVFLNTFSTLLIEAVSGYKNFDSAADGGGHGDGFVADVAGPAQSKEDTHSLQVEFFSEDQTSDVVDKFLTDEVFDADIIDRDGQRLYTDEEEDVISVESGSHLSHDILSPAPDSERKTSLNFDNISVGSDSRDLVVATGDEVTGDGDSRGGEGSSNETDGGICITVTPQKLNLTTDASLVGSDGSDYNVANVAAETIKWLAHRLGPVLTAKHISRNLLRMLALCYIGEEQLTASDCHGIFPSTTDKYVVGDQQAALLLECLAFIATLYGENIILLQYLQHVKELVPMLSKSFMAKSEGSLVSCLVLLLYIIPYMSDALLMDVLQETMFVGILQPLMDVVASNQLSFPSGSLARRLACYRLVDVLCIISLRIGFENTRQHMTLPIQKLFEGFSHVHDEKTLEANLSSVEMMTNAATVPMAKKEAADAESDADALHEVRLNLNTNQFTVDVAGSKHKRQSSLGSLKQHSLSPSVQNNGTEESAASNPETTNCDRILQELRETFTPEMAHTAYVPICKLAGGIHVEQHLSNDDLIRSLCTLYDQSLVGQRHSPSPSVTSGGAAASSSGKSSAPSNGDSVFGDNLMVEGNKIVIRKEAQTEVDQGHTKMSILSCGSESPTLRNSDMKADTRRHLRGNWLAYWEHEVGLNDRVRDFNLKQITLQSFQGHSSAIRDLLVLDNENSFISASKDRTVKLWSLRSYGDGSAKVGCQWTYTKHKKAVASVTFLDSIRLVASCDGNIHIWDPFMGMNVRQINAGRSFTVNVMSALPAPSSTILTASSDSILRFIDGRCGRFTHQFRTAISPPGAIRSTAVSQDGRTVAVGFSTGLITALDLRTGYSVSTWKAHEAEIIEMKTFDSKRFVSSGLDQMMSVWRHDDGKMMSSIKGLAEPVHRFSFYKDMVVAGSASNKVYVGSCIDSMAEFSCTKLKGDIFRGALSALTILPLNRLLLIGSDHGDIKLLA